MEEDELTYRPLSQYLIDLPEFSPFFYSYHYYDPKMEDQIWNASGTSPFSDVEENIRNWSNFYQDKYSEKELMELIYAEPAHLQAFQNALKEKQQMLLKMWPNNRLANRWKRGEGLEELDYLLFAHSVVPLVQGPDWWSDEVWDIPAMTAMKEEAIQRLQTESNPGIRQRYAFQAMRLAHYSRQYDECLLLFEQYVKDAGTSAQLYWWNLSLKAGAHLGKGEYAAAAYYNSLVFSQSPSKRKGAERDFLIPDDVVWNRTLSMCRNAEEEKNLWLLAGINQPNRALTAMQEILTKDAAAWQLELLLAREVEKYQRSNMPDRGDWFTTEKNPYWEPLPGVDGGDLLNLIRQGTQTGKVRTPAFWYAAEALIHLLQGNQSACEASCKQALNFAGKDVHLQQQARSLLLLNQIRFLPEIDTQTEAAILPELIWMSQQTDLHTNDTYRLTMHQLSNLYLAKGDLVRAEMCLNQATYTDPYEHITRFPVDDMITYYKQSQPAAFDQFLMQVYPYTLNDMLDIKATIWMRDYNWKEAAAVLNSMTGDGSSAYVLAANPFDIHIYDCHECDELSNATAYTKLAFCNKMDSLHTALKQSDNKDASICTQLANAYYNISYFGNSWYALDYYRNSSFFGYWGWEYDERNWPLASDDPESMFDNSLALMYYQAAVRNSKDKEEKAMNIFMAAKCEQNAMYVSGKKVGIATRDEYSTNFARLQKEYRNTQFYRDAIEACTYFAYYVRTSN
jgi:hypothetical protein